MIDIYDSGTKRPKDGSKNKVCEAIATLPSFPRSRTYEAEILSDGQKLRNLPAVRKAAEKANPNGLVSKSLDQLTIHFYHSKNAQCMWWFSNEIPSFNISKGGVAIWTSEESSFYHALAHLLCPDDVPLHGFEFVTIFIDLVEAFGINGLSGSEAKKMVKQHFIGRKIKTFKRTRAPKTPEQIIAELKAIHQKL